MTTIGGETPLMKAATCGHEKITQMLMEAGANVNAAANNGFKADIFAKINQPNTAIESMIKQR